MPGENEDVKKMAELRTGMSWRMKLFLFMLLIGVAAMTLLISISIMENRGSFLKQCQWKEEYLRFYGEVKDESSAFNILKQHANTTDVVFSNDFDIKCYGQYYFYNTRTDEKYYVCDNNLILKMTPYNCSYNYDLDYIPELTNTFTNNTTA